MLYFYVEITRRSSCYCLIVLPRTFAMDRMKRSFPKIMLITNVPANATNSFFQFDCKYCNSYFMNIMISGVKILLVDSVSVLLNLLCLNLLGKIVLKEKLRVEQNFALLS